MKKYRGRGKKAASSRNYQDEAMIREKEKGHQSGIDAKYSNGKVCRSVKDFSNDANWYFKDQRTLEDVASFSYDAPLGDKLHPNKLVPANFSNYATAVPGLFVAGIGPCFGVSADGSSPVNLAALNVYSYVRYKNSGSKNYDAPDLMMYLLTMDSIYSCWNWLKRIYGEASTYSQRNKYMPKAYFKAEGVDMMDVISNLANFRGFLNVAASRISAFCVPAVMPLFVRHSWLFSNIYKDANIHKAQQYMFVPSYFYKYDETTNPKGGQLVPLNVRYNANNYTTLLKVSDLINLLNELIDAAQTAEDIGVMSGDILKAYGEGNLFTLSTVDPDYKVEPVYNEEVLMQIENMSHGLVGVAHPDITTLAVTQDPDTNWIIFDPAWTVNPAHTLGRIVNMHKDNPTASDVMVATRLVNSTFTGSDGKTHYSSVGSEIVWDMWIVTNVENFADPAVPVSDDNTPLDMVLIHFAQTGFADTNTIQQNLQVLLNLWMQSAFDWAPRILSSVTMNDKTVYIPWQMDYANYTVVMADQLAAIDQLALLSELDVPN